MRAHNVIITTAESQNVNGEALDRAIAFVQGLKKNPILVLGPDGDEWLAQSKLSEACDLAFDPNYEGEIFSNVKAGLQATTGAAFVISVASELPPSTIFIELDSVLMTDAARQVDVLAALPQANDAEPLVHLVTARGVKALKSLGAQTNWKKSEAFVGATIPIPFGKKSA